MFRKTKVRGEFRRRTFPYTHLGLHPCGGATTKNDCEPRMEEFKRPPKGKVGNLPDKESVIKKFVTYLTP